MLRRLRRNVRRLCTKRAAPRKAGAVPSHRLNADRKALLLGTALVSSFIAGCLSAPSAALAVPCSLPGPAPILESTTSPIVCVNTDTRIGGPYAIDLETTNDGNFINLNNSGGLQATYYGIVTSTAGVQADINVVNSGDITVQAPLLSSAFGIAAETTRSDIAIENSGDIHVQSADLSSVYGIAARSLEGDVVIDNSGQIIADSTGILDRAFGIAAETVGGDITIQNSGDITATGGIPLQHAIGISAQTVFGNILISNSGAVTSSYHAIATRTGFGNTAIENRGPLTASVDGIYATALQSNIAILNSGDITAGVHGIHAYAGCGCYGMAEIAITNSAKIDAGVIGILAGTGSARIAIQNTGAATAAYAGILAFTGYDNSGIAITNTGKISAGTVGILAATGVYDDSCGCSNIPDLVPTGYGANSPVSIVNSGSVYGAHAGIIANSSAGTTIVNSGTIGAGSGPAIGVFYGPARIYNSGRITGYVLLDADDLFVNQAGGTFEAKGVSDFDTSGSGGNDLFVNEKGATVQAATDANVKETTVFVGLERFENKGLISLHDGAAGDIFEISNCYCTLVDFAASGQSTLAVDAFLGGAGKSSSDILIIDGNVSGKTKVEVTDTNPGPGVLNKTPIPVIYVTGATPTGNEFYLAKPVDTGFFDYDLYFTPTGSGVWSLKSFLGQGAFVLPQLITAAQDTWHASASTWFDRTADLRVLLNGGASPAEDDKSLAPRAQSITPAVWARGSGGFLDREDSAGVTAYGRDYRFNLDRSLQTIDFQSGIDLGRRGLLSENDILVFGALGGFVHSDLDYDAFPRLFSFSGGEIGGYATYLRGGLFVDTLLNVQLMTLETQTLGFPGSLSATTVGVRTDSGYRFGSFRGGPFIEPLATISVDWTDIDGFSLGGNTVSFNREANVQGRLGVRVGTSTVLWQGLTIEPFVIGSLWGNLSNDNQARLVSTGTTFVLKDDLQDVWGEVSAGVNVFNPTASTSVFAKLDVTFGDGLDGVGGKAGLRVSW